MPVFWSGCLHDTLLFGLCQEVGVGHTKAVIRAQLQQALSSLTNFANSKMSKTRGSGVVVWGNTSIRVTEEENIILAGAVHDDIAKGGKNTFFASSVDVRALMRLTGSFKPRRWRVIRRSENFSHGCTILSKVFLPANPTPFCLCSSEFFYPARKKVYR